MIFAKRLKGKAISAWLGPTGDAARRAISNARQRITKAPRRLEFYFDPTEPWSYLTAQAVARLIDAYPVELGFHAITPAASDVDPAPLLRQKYAVRDARELAAYWDLEFPGKKEPDGGMVRDIGTVLIRQRPAREQLTAAIELAHAMWSVDKKKLVTLVGKFGSESHGSVAPILNEAYAGLRKAGHYLPAMIHYNDTWYWGIDRLTYLEAELARDFGTEIAHVLTPRPVTDRGALPIADKPLAKPTLEMWYSFRSPYSYIALEQIEAILAPYGIPLVLKPVAPLVTRGLPMPTVKQMYIVRDAKREADRLNIPFGELCDPLGVGIDHCLAIAHWAGQRGAGAAMAFARSAMRGIWTEAKDVAAYVDLREIVERANLPWEEAREAIANPAAAKAAHDNVADLNGIGLWGVPSFRIGDFVAWGQDRLPLLADRLRRHALVVPAPAATESS